MQAKYIPKEELRTMYSEEYLSLKDIAEFFDCSKTTIQKRMIEYGIPRRDIGELRSHGLPTPCSKCGKLKSSLKYDVCKDCWAKKHGRERWTGGRLVPVGYVRKKRKFEKCLNCGGSVKASNRSGYCKNVRHYQR